MSNDGERVNRRTVLQTIGVAGAFGLAGCSGGGSSDPTDTASGTRTTDTESESPSTARITETETATATETTPETEADEGCPNGGDPSAGVSIGKDGDEVVVTVVSLDENADSVVARGCESERTAERVGEELRIAGCPEGSTVEIFAKGCGGVTNLVREYDVASATETPDEGDGSDLAATLEYDQSGTDVTVTWRESSDATERVELIGCANDAALTQVGESVTVTACERGQTIDALAVSADGRTQPVSRFSLSKVPNAQVTIVQDADGITVTASKLGGTTTEIELGGCDQTGTISSEGGSATASGCSGGPLTLTAHHEEAPSIVLAEYEFETTASGDPPEATINLTRNGNRVAALVESTGPNVEAVETTGCGGGIDSTGTIVTNTDCGLEERVTFSVRTGK